ncbi:MAG: hypothetical protein ABI151_03050 [Chitinophagaceae bacterium]
MQLKHAAPNQPANNMFASNRIGMTPRMALIIFLILLSQLSGYLISKASFFGGMGMSLFYRNYAFLKTWWKGAIVVFILLMALLAIQAQIQQRVEQAKRIQIIILVFAAVGLYFTFSTFRHDLSYRLMGERFHLGFYLFWIGSMIISLYYIFVKSPLIPTDPTRVQP